MEITKSNSENGWEVAEGLADKVIVHAHPRRIALCYNEKSKHSHIYPNRAEAMANAKLIAAAPELLEALKMCLDNLENGESKTKYRLITCLSAATEAIKKATYNGK